MRYIVWIGGVDNHFKTLAEAVGEAQRWLVKGYDDVIIQDIETGELYS
jgi:hypothetical protein